jgi:hypothetical protein
MAASAHSWDFLLLRLRELRLPLLRGLGSGKKGAKQLSQSRIFFLLVATSLTFLAAHRLLFGATFRLFCTADSIGIRQETRL